MFSNAGMTPHGQLIRSPYYIAPANLAPQISLCNIRKSYTVNTKAVAPSKKCSRQNTKEENDNIVAPLDKGIPKLNSKTQCEGEVLGLEETICPVPTSSNESFTGPVVIQPLIGIKKVSKNTGPGRVFNLIQKERRKQVDKELSGSLMQLRNSLGSDGSGVSLCGNQVAYPQIQTMVTTDCLEPFGAFENLNVPSVPEPMQNDQQTRLHPTKNKKQQNTKKCYTVNRSTTNALSLLRNINNSGRIGNPLSGNFAAVGSIPSNLPMAFSVQSSQHPINSLNVKNRNLL